MSDERGFLALRDRAYAFLLRAGGDVAEAALLNHVYGGQAPPPLHARLREPLLGDPRLARGAEGQWSVRERLPRGARDATVQALTTLALAATGPRPERGRVVQVAAVHLFDGHAAERFSSTVHPGRRVPRYVAERLGLATEVLDDRPPFTAVLDDLVRFLDARPIVAQDARLAWAFVAAEARRMERVLAPPVLVDASELFSRALTLRGKPTLALVAAHVGVGTTRLERPDEEARVLGEVLVRLLAEPAGRAALGALIDAHQTTTTPALQRSATARALPDAPGVYVLRDGQQMPLYVGKARRLRSRVAAYVHRPLGATRRLEGLVGTVEAVDPTLCPTDLEALVLEDRQIHHLQPRFNTARRQRTPRLWIRLPPLPESRPGKRRLAARRLQRSRGPTTADGDFVGPFRNEMAAERARQLARQVFDLDARRSADDVDYEARLDLAWRFLQDVPGASDVAEAHARARSVTLLRAVLAFDVQSLLLPADPRETAYAVVRPTPRGVEAFLIDRGIFRTHATLDRDDEDTAGLAARLLADTTPRTRPEDADVVLRWLGAQRPPAALTCLPLEPWAAAAAVERAARSALAAIPGDA